MPPASPVPVPPAAEPETPDTIAARWEAAADALLREAAGKSACARNVATSTANALRACAIDLRNRASALTPA